MCLLRFAGMVFLLNLIFEALVLEGTILFFTEEEGSLLLHLKWFFFTWSAVSKILTVKLADEKWMNSCELV